MKQITVVDARMGRGKSSAAIRYMNQNKESKRFLYITPYLSEVERICKLCGFEQPNSDCLSKSTELKNHIRKGNSVAATHALFYLMDEEALELIHKHRYSIIIDESIEVINRMNTSDKDFDLICLMTEERDDGTLRWLDESYYGKFSGYKKAADAGSLLRLDHALLNIMNPSVLKVFDEVFMLTYLFDGQYQKAYLDFFGFNYRIVGVKHDKDGFYFSDMPDEPEPIDYSSLIEIVSSKKMNQVGDKRFALSKNWYTRRGRSHKDICELRKNMRNFFETQSRGDSSTRLWTSFKEEREKLIPENGRYRNNFLQMTAKGTNEYRDRKDIAYMLNRFADPNIIKYFARRDIIIDQDDFALSEMLQWIWRSAIRDDKPINLYIPSSRMRGLLTDWIKKNQGGQLIG